MSRFRAQSGSLGTIVASFLILTFSGCSSTNYAGSARVPVDSVADERITESITARLSADPKLSPCPFEVDTNAGVVTLRGTFSAIRSSDEAIRIASSTPGVRRVIDLTDTGLPGEVRGVFPEELPRPTTQDDLNIDLILRGEPVMSRSRAARNLMDELSRMGYTNISWFQLEGGFAVVLPAECINSTTGAPRGQENRWCGYEVKPEWDFERVVRFLTVGGSEFIRFVVIVVAPDVPIDYSLAYDSEQMLDFYENGVSSPRRLEGWGEGVVIRPDHQVRALIYLYEKPGPFSRLRFRSNGLSALVQLAATGLTMFTEGN